MISTTCKMQHISHSDFESVGPGKKRGSEINSIRGLFLDDSGGWCAVWGCGIGDWSAPRADHDLQQAAVGHLVPHLPLRVSSSCRSYIIRFPPVHMSYYSSRSYPGAYLCTRSLIDLP